MRALAHGDGLQPFVTPDPVLHMDHQIAGMQRGQFSQESVRILAAFLAAHQPVAQNVLFGDQLQRITGKAGFQRQHHGSGTAPGGQPQRFLPAFGQGHPGPGLGQNGGEAGAAAGGIGGDQRLLAARGHAVQIFRGRFVDIVAARAFRCEIAGG